MYHRKPDMSINKVHLFGIVILLFALTALGWKPTFADSMSQSDTIPMGSATSNTNQPDQIWHPNPNEAYEPSTYCQWNRTGLPEAQQKICLELDRKNPPKVYKPKPGEVVTTLISNCHPGGGLSCNADIYQKVWLQVEAVNGEVTKINMNSIQHLNSGSALVNVYTTVPNTKFDPSRLSTLIFDCAGHYKNATNFYSPLFDAPPRSVAGKVASIACARDYHSSTQTDQTEYCEGFSHDACNRMKKVINAKIRPPFCKAGFALVGSTLTSEQLRICYVMTSPSFH